MEEAIKRWPYEGAMPPLIALVASLQSEGHPPSSEIEWGTLSEIEATLVERGKSVEQVGLEVTQEQARHNETRYLRERWFGPWPKICKLAQAVLVETGVCVHNEASDTLRQLATRWNSQEFLELEYEGGREISLRANDEQVEWHICVRSPESVLAAVGIKRRWELGTPEELAQAIDETLATTGKIVIPVGPLGQTPKRKYGARPATAVRVSALSVKTRRRAAATLAINSATWTVLKQQPQWVISETVNLGSKATTITTGEPSRWGAKLVLASAGIKNNEKLEEAVSETLKSWPWPEQLSPRARNDENLEEGCTRLHRGTVGSEHVVREHSANARQVGRGPNRRSHGHTGGGNREMDRERRTRETAGNGTQHPSNGHLDDENIVERI